MTNRARTFSWCVVVAACAAALLSSAALGDRPYSRVWADWRGLSVEERQEFRARYQALVRSNSRDEMLRRARQFAALPEA
ncbi:MAG: hypothetical protein JNG88_13035, partial [Phycisphaerales bacterium]|nr:hypothetical protein [Phycisphaerales bacterium]